MLEVARRTATGEALDLASLASPSGVSPELPPSAARLERAYDWIGAARAYEAALASLPAGDARARGELFEHLAFALGRAAFQAADPDEFRAGMEKAIEACGKAEGAYSRTPPTEDSARTARCHATKACYQFWVARSMDERRTHLAEAWDAMRTSLAKFEEAGDAREYGVTRNRLSLVPVMKSLAAWDARAEESTSREAVQQGERAVLFLSEGSVGPELARAWTRTAGDLNYLGVRLAGREERDVLVRRAVEYWRKAKQLSEETMLQEPLVMAAFEGDGTEATLAMCRRMLTVAEGTKDRLLQAFALQGYAYHQYWKCLTVEDLDEWGALLRNALEASEQAKRHLNCIAFGCVFVGSFMGEGARAEYHHEASRREIDPRERAAHLTAALAAGREGVKRAEAFGFPDGIINAHAPLADTLTALAETEEDPQAKRRWLQELVDEIDRMFWMLHQRTPGMSVNLGDCTIARARAEAALADSAGTAEAKVALLRKAADDAETGLDLFMEGMPYWERLGDVSGYAYIGYYLTNIADAYTRLYEFTGDKTYLRRGTAMLDRVADLFRRSGLPSRVAECHWQAGRLREALEDYLKAADEFAAASIDYKAASQRVPQLHDFYQDLALYMQAWNEIEKARYHHSREEYGEARDCYERAASLHGFSRHWAILADNYSAWMKLEGAEELSRAEKGTEAISAFMEAERLFRQARASLQKSVNSTQETDERRMIEGLILAAERRRAYCAARVTLEEARILNKHGEHVVGSKRFGETAVEFESLASGADSERDRRDLNLIATLSRAWEAMAMAEAETSPDRYAEASRLFDAARDASSSERAKALAAGHSRFCLALEAGTRFADARDPALYEAAITQLDSAAGHYARAGAETASDYSRGSRFLFDAYAVLDQAGRDRDPETKAKAYLAGERMLEASISAFERAGQLGKRDEARRLLIGVRREREVASSLMELFQAPMVASSTTAFPAPMATYEQAVGIEKLGHADLHAETVLVHKALPLGGDFELGIELVNAGRAAGQLVAVEGMIPAGFELVSAPAECAVEGHDVSLKGRRLEPLKSKRLRIVLRPTALGAFTFRPRLVYLDQSGSRETCEPEPIDVRVSAGPGPEPAARRTRPEPSVAQHSQGV